MAYTQRETIQVHHLSCHYKRSSSHYNTHIHSTVLFLCELELAMKLLLIVATLLGLVLLTTAGGGRRRKCPFIDRPENGYGRGSRRIGNSIRFSCKRGYWLQGPQSLTCLDVKGQPTWSSSVVPFCVLKSKLTISPYTVLYNMFFLLNKYICKHPSARVCT